MSTIVLHGDAQPDSDFPISAVLADLSRTTIRHYPAPFVQALESGDTLQVIRAVLENWGEIATLLLLFPYVEFRVVYDVLVFVLKAYFEVGDAQGYALCELAIMESALSNEEKDESLSLLRKTAPNSTVEFEYYVSLLVPIDGSLEDQAFHRNAANEIRQQRYDCDLRV